MRFFLLGFMGAGKTFWGRQWATVNAISFYDLDEIIETKECRPVSDIFEKNGEDYFRQKEAIALRSLLDIDNCIIACGGGTPCFYDNLEWMNKNGTTISLIAGADFILDNVKKEDGKRPLFKNLNEEEVLLFIKKKLEERMPFYTSADFIFKAEDLDIHSLDVVLHQNS